MNISEDFPSIQEIIRRDFQTYLTNYRVWTLVESWFSGNGLDDDLTLGYPGLDLSKNLFSRRGQSDSMTIFRVLSSDPSWNKFTGGREFFTLERINWGLQVKDLKVPINEIFGHYRYIPTYGSDYGPNSWSDFVVLPFDGHYLKWVLHYLKFAIKKQQDFYSAAPYLSLASTFLSY